MIICADARRIPLADETVQCCVTSPPYWGLRKYAGEQELVWGGRERCEHEWSETTRRFDYRTGTGGTQNSTVTWPGALAQGIQTAIVGACARCGAWRGAYGLEPTVEMYVAHTVEILREIRRVLRADGVCFWNIGDSYAANRSYQVVDNKHIYVGNDMARKVTDGLKPKDLCLIPQRVTLAAQANGWWVRSDIIWAKPNPMPESCKDRPTDAYEHVLMLTKSARYYWDADAVAEEQSSGTFQRFGKNNAKTSGPKSIGRSGNPTDYCALYGISADGKRNLRNVWTFATQPYKGAHFATFPEELPKRCILAASKSGDIVLDPFAGSGTTGRVAIALGRVPVMLDLAYGAEYRELAERRTSEVQIEAFA